MNMKEIDNFTGIKDSKMIHDHDDYVWNIMTISSVVIYCDHPCHLMVIVVIAFFIVIIYTLQYEL